MFRPRNRKLNRVLLFKKLVPDFRRCKACHFKHFSVQVFLVMYDRQFAWSIGKCRNSVLSNKTYQSLWSGHAQLASGGEGVSGKLYIYRLELQRPIDEKDAVTVTRIETRIMQIRSEYFTLCFLRPDIAVLVDEQRTLSFRWKLVIVLQNGKHEYLLLYMPSCAAEESLGTILPQVSRFTF